TESQPTPTDQARRRSRPTRTPGSPSSLTTASGPPCEVEAPRSPKAPRRAQPAAATSPEPATTSRQVRDAPRNEDKRARNPARASTRQPGHPATRRDDLGRPSDAFGVRPETRI